MKSYTWALIIITTVITGCLAANEAGVTEVNEFADLYKNGTTIAVCDPNHCPAGRYAYMVISNFELKDVEKGEKLRANIVTNDPNVRAVLDKVVTKEVDAGFVYITDALTEMQRVKVIEIPREYLPVPQYGISIVKGSKNHVEALLFIDFLMSKEGQKILQSYGFSLGIEVPEPFERNGSKSEGSITVYAASSLTDAFLEAAKEFENQTGIKVVIGFGSSGTLRQRIEGGAPVDVYATASLKHAEILIKEGLIDDSKVFARNHLVVVAPR